MSTDAMTWEQARTEIERMDAERTAADAAARAAITPHVRRPSTETAAQRRAAYGRYGTNYSRRAQPRPTTYCGAEPTVVDWDRRGALARSNAALIVECGVCPTCLNAVRT